MINEQITTAKTSLKVTLTDKATPEQAMKAVDSICGALRTAESSVERFRCLLGKVLVEIQDKGLFKPAFDSFEKWTQSIAEKHKLSRATIRESIMVARRLPNLTPEQAETIPMTSLALAARAVKPGETDEKAISNVLRMAATSPIAEFRNSLTTQGLLKARETEAGFTTLRVKVADRVAALFNKLSADQDPSQFLSVVLKAYQATLKANAVEKVMTAGRAA